MNYPLDPPGLRLSNLLVSMPSPTYPYADTVWQHIISPRFYDASLGLAVPVTFAAVYYGVAHAANLIQHGHDYSKGPSVSARALRAFVVAHNAALCVYSLWTFLMSAPVAVDMLVQGWRAAGGEGIKLALCSMPTNNSLLGRWTYLFYLSKYYEVMDSVILYLKGKKIGNLQSYHHAGALFSMWIGYRFGSQPLWVFVVFNSFVHTLMYAYYCCAALKLPFPRSLKRNLTTLQILQIFFGVLLADSYFLIRLNPVRVYAQLLQRNISSALSPALFASNGYDAPRLAAASSKIASIFSPLGGSKGSTSTTHAGASLMQLSTYAQARTLYAPEHQSSCMPSSGVELALIGNTLYMAPLLVLFANFYVKSYLKQQQQQQAVSKANGHAKGHANGKIAAHQNGNGDGVAAIQ